ncbi:type II toxin-antitoxin system antitoxin SocA domain-containing protein [Capnocytophaga canimorsus]|uniref:type II toxin-antitoxin system antitoxin SocA domain-containing protein n=1 Tax=Capnocytophaga canimorsus TaxID=28188 RepID=UPI0037D12A00
MGNPTKIQAFEEVLYHLNKWYEEKNPGKDNDLSILKTMKLLFFVSGVDPKNHLFEVFNDFQAWQYGHVEAEVYNEYSVRKGVFNYFKLDRNRLFICKEYHKVAEHSIIKQNVEELKKLNPDLVSYDAFRLVDISHSYDSWDIYYNKLNKRYENINTEMLIYETKYYR